MTLYHWDLPQALHDEYGGWQSKDTAHAFADYAGYVAGHLGDRVKHYFTINEFASFVEGGYQGLDVQVRRSGSPRTSVSRFRSWTLRNMLRRRRRPRETETPAS